MLPPGVVAPRHRLLLFMFLAIFVLPNALRAQDAGLNAVMHEREPYFEAVDRETAPDAALARADGTGIRLAGFRDRVVVLYFLFASCPDVCPLHSDLIARIQGMVNRTALRDRVRFVAITTDPENDTREVLQDYARIHGLDETNWTILTVAPGSPKETTRNLASAYNVRFDRLGGPGMVHGVVTHVIDRDGRYAARFHGLDVKPLNVVTYLDALINNRGLSGQTSHLTAWQRFRAWWLD